MGLVMLPVAFARAEGCQLWDSEGKAYLDLLAGIAVMNVGHSHNRHQTPNVQAVGGWIETDIAAGHFFLQLFFSAGHYVLDQVSGF